MRSVSVFFICVCVLVVTSTSGIAQSGAVLQPGTWVLGNYRALGYWYPGVVAEVQGNGVVVRYDDGDVEFLDDNRYRPYNWRVGSRVECNYRSAGTWYSGTIAQLGSTNLSINYDDGDFERTQTGLCRSR